MRCLLRLGVFALRICHTTALALTQSGARWEQALELWHPIAAVPTMWQALKTEK